MVKKVHQLWARLLSIEDEFRKLMPKQYAKNANDPLGNAWKSTAMAIGSAEAHLDDLVTYLDFKAQKADERAQAETLPQTDTKLPDED
jgi:hypothetical protein